MIEQANVLPKVQSSETEIKKLVALALLLGWSAFQLRKKIQEELNKIKLALKGLSDSREYYFGALRFADNSMRFFTRERINLSEEQTTLKDLWAAKKGDPYYEYAKDLKNRLREYAETGIKVGEGKKPITIWQRAELDVRYESQMRMVQDLKNEGVDLCYISTHPDCSERCEPWQGKLVSLSKHATGPNFLVGKVDGKNVYSLTDIMNQVDKYGYKNNIICGFNCRHKLEPYRGQLHPTSYTKEEVEEQRKIEQKIRKMEREIRKVLSIEKVERSAGNIKTANSLKEKAKLMIEKYKDFCNKHGYPWEKYRIEV